MAKKEESVNNNERVEISLPRGTKYSAFVSVNGVAYNIPAKGSHAVPPEIAAEWERSLRAEDVRDANNAAILAQQQDKAQRV